MPLSRKDCIARVGEILSKRNYVYPLSYSFTTNFTGTTTQLQIPTKHIYRIFAHVLDLWFCIVLFLDIRALDSLPLRDVHHPYP